MKKIIAGAALAALTAGMAFADGPVANWSVAEFSGYGQAKWGVDLDAGKTGFENDEKIKLEFNLFDKGSKTTEKNGDIWAELKLSAGNTQWWDSTSKNELEKNGEKAGQGDYSLDTKFSFGVDEVKLHFGNAYIGLRSGDTQTGEYKFDGAIRSADNDNAKWLTNVGPADYSQGIVAGYGDNNFGVDVDLRSYYKDTKTFYTNAYAVAAEAKLKDSNEFVSGLGVDAGVSYSFSPEYYTKDDSNKAVKNLFSQSEELKIKDSATKFEATKVHTLGYSFNAAYKLSLDDKLYVKPAIGLTGTLNDGVTTVETKEVKATKNSNSLVAGVMFGWGATADANAGVPYLDGDYAKKVTPGLSVVAAIPLDATYKTDSGTATIKNKINAIIVPSFYTTNDIEGLTAGVYSEMALLKSEGKTEFSDNNVNVTVTNAAANKDRTFAFAIAAGAKYDIKADAVTVTPSAGMRFANAAYFENNINSESPLSSNKVFENGLGKMGVTNPTKAEEGYLNVKAGVNVNGLINNTDIFVNYESANLLNSTEYNDVKYYNVKAGTLNVGAKISL